MSLEISASRKGIQDVTQDLGREETNGMAIERRAGQGHGGIKHHAGNVRVIQYSNVGFNTARSIGAKSAQKLIWLYAKTTAIIFGSLCARLDLPGDGNRQATLKFSFSGWLCTLRLSSTSLSFCPQHFRMNNKSHSRSGLGNHSSYRRCSGQGNFMVLNGP